MLRQHLGDPGLLAGVMSAKTGSGRIAMAADELAEYDQFVDRTPPSTCSGVEALANEVDNLERYAARLD
jgi:hypothetical protein